MSEPLRVAIVGASGIGRHHANWHDAVGSRVVAFVGTTPERCHETSTALASTFDFSGRGYTSIDEMLQQERPDLVDVCSPNPTHYHATLRALQAGCHVLCEKPLVWDGSLSGAQLAAQIGEIERLAAAHGRHVGMCSQLTAVLPQYDRLCRTGSMPARFVAQMETTSREHLRSAAEVWVDMAPHPISLILARYPDAQVDPSTLEVRFEGHAAQASFEVIDGSQRCHCEIMVCDKQPPLRRCFGFDDQIVEMSGRPGEDGYYRSVLSREGVEDVDLDPMHRLIGQFSQVAGGQLSSPLVSTGVALRNLQIMLTVSRRA